MSKKKLFRYVASTIMSVGIGYTAGLVLAAFTAGVFPVFLAAMAGIFALAMFQTTQIPELRMKWRTETGGMLIGFALLATGAVFGGMLAYGIVSVPYLPKISMLTPN